jgi:methylmalonyl-CoA epimerase
LTIVNSLKEYIIGLQHIGHIVSDLDVAVASFQRLYGVDDSTVRRVPEQPDAKAPTLFAFITVGDTEFELIQPQSATARALLLESPAGGGGINHVAWRVRDIDACVSLLAQQGVAPGHVTPDGVVDTGRSRIVYLDPQDTDGILIELVELAG